jgi:hypothetical protein
MTPKITNAINALVEALREESPEQMTTLRLFVNCEERVVETTGLRLINSLLVLSSTYFKLNFLCPQVRVLFVPRHTRPISIKLSGISG